MGVRGFDTYNRDPLNTIIAAMATMAAGERHGKRDQGTIGADGE